jgi:hypothetical protein
MIGVTANYLGNVGFYPKILINNFRTIFIFSALDDLGAMWFVAEMARLPDVPHPRSDLPHDLCDGYAKDGEAVQDGDPDLELRDPTIKVPRGQALAQQFATMHLGFDMASAVVAAPSTPDRPAEAFGCTQGLVARDRAGSVRASMAWRSCAAG